MLSSLASLLPDHLAKDNLGCSDFVTSMFDRLSAARCEVFLVPSPRVVVKGCHLVFRYCMLVFDAEPSPHALSAGFALQLVGLLPQDQPALC